jgi:hypothetical protein
MSIMMSGISVKGGCATRLVGCFQNVANVLALKYKKMIDFPNQSGYVFISLQILG